MLQRKKKNSGRTIQAFYILYAVYCIGGRQGIRAALANNKPANSSDRLRTLEQEPTPSQRVGKVPTYQRQAERPDQFLQ